MKPIYYRPTKLALATLSLGASATFLLWMGESLLSTVLGCLSAIGAVAAGVCVIDQRPALALTGRTLAIRTMFRLKLVDLSDILVVSVETRAVRLWGVIPIARKEFLVIRVEGGLIGSEKFTLTGGMLALPPGGLPEVCQSLKEVRGSVAGGSATAATYHGADDEGAAGFDPDAVIARYLAQKAAAPPPDPNPVKSGLRPGAPARPTFGRRVA